MFCLVFNAISRLIRGNGKAFLQFHERQNHLVLLAIFLAPLRVCLNFAQTIQTCHSERIRRISKESYRLPANKILLE